MVVWDGDGRHGGGDSRIFAHGFCVAGGTIMRTQISEERTQIILLADTTSDALRDQTLLSKSKSFLESANFNFDNLGP